MYLMEKISRAGLILAVVGILLMGVSLGDTVISFKQPKSFEDLLEDGAAPGDHVSGQVPFLLDAFANMQTYTENTKTHSTTPKKTSRQYYVLPGPGFLALSVNSQDIAQAEKLVDQTYDYMLGGDTPTAELSVDARVAPMDEEIAEMYREEMRDYYGYSDDEIAEIESMNGILMVEPRAFGTIRAFCAVGAAAFLAGVLMLVLRWRKINARIRRAREAAPGPDLD